jgi:ABC-2 type transport system permease protein
MISDIEAFIAGNEIYQRMVLGPARIEFAIDEGLDPDQMTQLFRAAVAEAGHHLPQVSASMMSAFMALFAVIPPLLFIMRAKSEEKAVRTELVLATPISRRRYLIGFTLIAYAMAVLLQFLQALGLQTVGASVLPNPEVLPLSFMLSAMMVYVPAIWVMVGIAIFFVGRFPKLTGLVWCYYVYTFMLQFIVSMKFVPEWMAYTSPFGFTPLVPHHEINWIPLSLLTAVAIVLTVAGFYFYSKRDINAITH